jgi:tRNA(Ile)-lysidine synthase
MWIGASGALSAAIIAVCDALPMDGSALETVRASDVVAPHERFVVLVSGGRDSVCLLDVLTSICGAPRLTALHVNYGLRGEESDGDERLVRELCDALGVKLEVCAAPPAPRQGKGNLQAWARDLRYARATLLARGAAVATGHTATDQAETVLYRLAASPGRRALLGMAPREGHLVRPLLCLTREETAAHCRARGLRWREDSSNDGTRFARSRVRNGLLRELRSVHPAAERNLLRSVEILRAEAAVLDEVTAVALAGRERIALERLAGLPPALARLAVIRLAEDAAGAPVPAVGARVGELIALAASGGSASLDVGGGVRALVEYGVLRFEAAAAAPTPGESSLSVPGSAEFGAWALRATLEPAGGAARTTQHAAGYIAVLDADRLRGDSLTVRCWRHGDRMRPLGLDGSKSLADLFADRRVPREQRHRLPVLESDGEIAWIPRVATSEEFRVQPGTERLAVLHARRPPQ